LATLSSAAKPLVQNPVVFTLYSALLKKTVIATRTTDLNGKAKLGVVTMIPASTP
jgi:hypothetical protein